MPYAPDEQRAYCAARNRERHESVREIGPPPPVANPDRRADCRTDLLRYLLTYHASAFPIPFCDDHIILISEVQRVILDGGCVVAAMPRGSGKTTICQRAELWAALYGHRRYPMLIAADDHKFKRLLAGIRTILENNTLLHEDFPEVCYPICSLERIANRANFQLVRGQPTYMVWGSELLIFPTTEETLAAGNAGVVIGGGGLTGAAVRGGVATLPSGEQIRPDCVLVDDPQTRKSAKSPAGVQEREDIISGDVLGMAGPGQTMAAMVMCTCIYRDDLAARLLDSERSPDWKSLKVQTIKTWPKMAKWEKYDGIRRQELLGELEEGAANEFYAANREEMDEGAQVYWEGRVDPGHLSALQTAMDDYYRNPRAFMAERQNTPEEELEGDLQPLSPLALVRRTHPYKRGILPPDATTITAHIDVQQSLLYWAVCAWTQTSRGYVIDYGTFPEQPRRYFVLRDVTRTLAAASPGNDESGAIRAGIASLCGTLAAKTFIRADGAETHIDRGIVDARWRPEDVEAAIVASKTSVWMPAYGTGIGAKDSPMTQWFRRLAGVRGNHWLITKPERRVLRSVFVDTNYWKTQLYQSLSVPPEHSSALTLYQEKHSHHQLMADHLAAERAVRVEAKGRIIDEWQLPPHKPDNHFWDNVVGCMAAASVLGIRRTAEYVQVARKLPHKRVRQLQL